jgi:quinol monooxygenase YgiN
MAQALRNVADHVRVHEPGTVSFFVSQDVASQCVFTTYERFIDKPAMDRHNNSEAVALFFKIAKPILEGDVMLITSTEICVK